MRKALKWYVEISTAIYTLGIGVIAFDGYSSAEDLFWGVLVWTVLVAAIYLYRSDDESSQQKKQG